MALIRLESFIYASLLVSGQPHPIPLSQKPFLKQSLTMIKFPYNKIRYDQQHKTDNRLIKTSRRTHGYITIKHKGSINIGVQRIRRWEKLAYIFRNLIKQPKIRSKNLSQVQDQ